MSLARKIRRHGRGVQTVSVNRATVTYALPDNNEYTDALLDDLERYTRDHPLNTAPVATTVDTEVDASVEQVFAEWQKVVADSRPPPPFPFSAPLPYPVPAIDDGYEGLDVRDLIEEP